jgi:hypothetical protein
MSIIISYIGTVSIISHCISIIKNSPVWEDATTCCTADAGAWDGFSSELQKYSDDRDKSKEALQAVVSQIITQPRVQPDFLSHIQNGPPAAGV